MSQKRDIRDWIESRNIYRRSFVSVDDMEHLLNGHVLSLKLIFQEDLRTISEEGVERVFNEWRAQMNGAIALFEQEHGKRPDEGWLEAFQRWKDAGFVITAAEAQAVAGEDDKITGGDKDKDNAGTR